MFAGHVLRIAIAQIDVIDGLTAVISKTLIRSPGVTFRATQTQKAPAKLMFSLSFAGILDQNLP